ncbi:phage tail protein [Streptomyces sp. NPDC001339]|uniref:phage tail protein n=1 Tax=Streptomyces sp. NPDC001339 TaxID=3364563 RepID=UPI0036B09D98
MSCPPVNLPEVLADDRVVQAFAAGLRAMVRPAVAVLDDLEYCLNPATAPRSMLDWLGAGARIPPYNVPEGQLRAALAVAGTVNRRRGTAAGLATDLSAYGWEYVSWMDRSGTLLVSLRRTDPAADSEVATWVVAQHVPAGVPVEVEGDTS